ncbi:DUF559 domain-containing protein [Planomonospora corallina]|uniref:DUF559 domain-containing protein n=1 Tax=Planomonospora corallina TaxID=1806052 RepID=A0ABV8II02_9ACTN
MDRVVHLRCADGSVPSPPEPPCANTPAVLPYSPGEARGAAEVVAGALRKLEEAALGLFPAWLPDAEGIDGAGTAAVRAVRALARRTATTRSFGPFLADLAEAALLGRARAVERFTPQVRATGLARALAAGSGRPGTALLVHLPAGLSASGQEVLVAGCEWLAQRSELGVWLTGAPPAGVDRIATVTVRPHAEPAVPAPCPPSPAAGRARPAGHGPAAGLPHPGSTAERVLESALAPCAWAAGREWNRTHRPHPLAGPVRLDLLWRKERCVVEIDGPEHRAPHALEADRRRDALLRRDGYAVLRVTNAQVLHDTGSVLRRIERFVEDRRSGRPEEH